MLVSAAWAREGAVPLKPRAVRLTKLSRERVYVQLLTTPLKWTTLAVLLSTTACTTLVYDARYDIDLSAVARRERGGDTKRFGDVRGHVFEDEFIKITWTPFDTQLGMILVNKSDSAQSVLWDEISYLGPDGKSDRVVHNGIEVAGAAVRMPPTVVAPHDTLLDLIEPTRHISLARYGVAGGRRDMPLIGVTHGTSAAKVQSQMVHGTIQLLVPIAANGTIHEYLFQFSVKGTVAPSGWAS